VDTSALQQNATETVRRLAIGKRPSRTLKVIAITYGFVITQGHPQCHHSIERIRFPIGYSTLIETIRLPFSSYSELFCQKSHILTYPNCIWPTSIVATGKRLAGSRCHLVRRYRPYPRPHCARWGTQLPLSEKGTQQLPTCCLC